MKKIAETAFPVHPLIAERWSPRAFASDGVTDEELGSLFEAARWASSCFNEQPWVYVWARRGTSSFAELLSALVEPNQVWAQHAAVLVFGVARTTFRQNGKDNGWAQYDLGQASAQLVLQGTSMGLVAHQMAGFRADVAREVLGLGDGEQPMVAIALGRPTDDLSALGDTLAERERGPRVRQAQADFVFEGRVR